jgi:hypothetical protein
MPPQNLPSGRAGGCVPPPGAGQDGRRERGGQPAADHRLVTWRAPRSGEHAAVRTGRITPGITAVMTWQDLAEQERLLDVRAQVIAEQKVLADAPEAEVGQREIDLRHRAAERREAAPASARSASCRRTSLPADTDGYQRRPAPTAGRGTPSSVPVR